MVSFNCPLDASIITWKECLSEGGRPDWHAGTCVGDCLDQLLIDLERSIPLWTAPFCRNQITEYINIEIKLSTGEIAYIHFSWLSLLGGRCDRLLQGLS